MLIEKKICFCGYVRIKKINSLYFLVTIETSFYLCRYESFSADQSAWRFCRW